ncbi:MAG: adenylate/guanylate cyclase domain-containing protein [Longimicrobiales bacterium]|nr:adenylate/guanylate cyclase domain-containing protein [Longimicrobiales bacterium]
MNSGDQHSESTVPRSLLIADIVSSTALYERLGDEAAKALIGRGMDLMSTCVRDAGGRVIKTLGDGILACFTGADAAEAALDMVTRMHDESTDIRVAAHQGEVIETTDDIFGDAVNTVARIAALARESEILLSATLFSQVSPRVKELARSVPPVSVKGKREPLELYSILDHGLGDADFEMTLMAPGAERVGNAARVLKLNVEGQTYKLEGDGALTIGRAADCEVLINHDKVSRTHAKIIYRHPEYLIADSSTNGTYIVPESGPSVHLNRRETVLFGRGRLYIGTDPAGANAIWIDFEVS